MIALHRSQIPPSKSPSFAQTMQRFLFMVPSVLATARVPQRRGARIGVPSVLPTVRVPRRRVARIGECLRNGSLSPPQPYYPTGEPGLLFFPGNRFRPAVIPRREKSKGGERWNLEKRPNGYRKSRLV